MKLKAILTSIMVIMSCTMTACSGTAPSDSDSLTSSVVDSKPQVEVIIPENVTGASDSLTESVLESETANNTSDSTNAAESDSEASEAPSESNTETSADNNEPSDASPDDMLPVNTGDITDEDVVKIAAVGFDSLIEEQWVNAYNYTDMEFLAYITFGERYSQKEFMNIMTRVVWSGETEDKPIMESTFGSLKNVSFQNPRKATAEEIQALNDFVLLVGESDPELFPDGIEYIIEDAYAVECHYDGSDEEFANTGTYPHMFVIKEGGNWKLDTYIALIMELYNAWDEMATGVDAE